MHWVHTQYWKMGPEGNDIQKTNVPALRMRFRQAWLISQHACCWSVCMHAPALGVYAETAGRAGPAALLPLLYAAVATAAGCCERHCSGNLLSASCSVCRKDCHVEETGLLLMGAANHAARLRAKEMYSQAE